MGQVTSYQKDEDGTFSGIVNDMTIKNGGTTMPPKSRTFKGAYRVKTNTPMFFLPVSSDGYNFVYDDMLTNIKTELGAADFAKMMYYFDTVTGTPDMQDMDTNNANSAYKKLNIPESWCANIEPSLVGFKSCYTPEPYYKNKVYIGITVCVIICISIIILFLLKK